MGRSGPAKALTYTGNIAMTYFGVKLAQATHLWSLCVEEQFYLLWPLVVLSSQDLFTLPLGLSLIGLGSTFLVDYNLWMASATLAVLPPLAFFLVFERHYLRGLEALSGLKG